MIRRAPLLAVVLAALIAMNLLRFTLGGLRRRPLLILAVLFGVFLWSVGVPRHSTQPRPPSEASGFATTQRGP